MRVVLDTADGAAAHRLHLGQRARVPRVVELPDGAADLGTARRRVPRASGRLDPGARPARPLPRLLPLILAPGSFPHRLASRRPVAAASFRPIGPLGPSRAFQWSRGMSERKESSPSAARADRRKLRSRGGAHSGADVGNSGTPGAARRSTARHRAEASATPEFPTPTVRHPRARTPEFPTGRGRRRRADLLSFRHSSEPESAGAHRYRCGDAGSAYASRWEHSTPGWG